MTAREDIAYLTGSEARVQTLRALAEEPMRPTRLGRTISCARETAQRNLSGFVDRNWVEKEGSVYRLTMAGRMVLERYEELEGTVESADQLSGFLSNVGRLRDEVDPQLLANQTVTTSNAENPHGPISRWLRLVDGIADEYYGMTPIVSELFNNAAERAIGPETHMELIIDESVLKTSQEEFPEALELALELEQFTLWILPEKLDFGLTICDGNVWLAAYDGLGNIVASVDGDDEAFVAWAHETYERYRKQSQQAESEHFQAL